MRETLVRFVVYILDYTSNDEDLREEIGNDELLPLLCVWCDVGIFK